MSKYWLVLQREWWAGGLDEHKMTSKQSLLAVFQFGQVDVHGDSHVSRV